MSNILVSFWNHLNSKRLKKVCLPYLSHETKYPSFMSGQLCMFSYSVMPGGSENFSILVSLLVTGQCLHRFQHCPLGVPWWKDLPTWPQEFSGTKTQYSKFPLTLHCLVSQNMNCSILNGLSSQNMNHVDDSTKFCYKLWMEPDYTRPQLYQHLCTDLGKTPPSIAILGKNGFLSIFSLFK